MSWGNPVAWLGAVLVVVPVLIHMIARSRARPHGFPTLRFFDTAHIIASRRSRLSDIPLLVVRALAILLAAGALAQPYLATAGRGERGQQHAARVVIVDTSASMQRATPAGERAVDAARAAAETLAGPGDIVVATSAPGAALQGAAALLARRGGVREIVIVSDFQLGAVDSLDVAGVSAGIGVRLLQVPVDSSARVPRPDPAPPAITVRAPSSRQVGMQAATTVGLRASGVLTLGATDAVSRVPVPEWSERFELVAAGAAEWPGALVDRDGRSASLPGLADALLRIAADEGLAAAAERAALGFELPAGATPVARTPDGRVAAAIVPRADGLVLLTDSTELLAAALAAASAREVRAPLPVRELTVAHVEAERLAAWERVAVAAAVRAGDDGTDGRWLWLAVLIVLALEAWVRRRSSASVRGAA